MILVLVVALVLVLVQALVWVLTGLGFHKYHYLTNVMVRPLPPPYPHFKVGGDIHRVVREGFEKYHLCKTIRAFS